MDLANTWARSLVMKLLPFESLAQLTAEAGCEHIPSTGAIEDYSLPQKVALVDEWNQWLCVTEDWAVERPMRWKSHLGSTPCRENLQEIYSQIQRKTLALEVKVRQSLNTNSKTAVVKVSLQSNQPLNSICAFLLLNFPGAKGCIC